MKIQVQISWVGQSTIPDRKVSGGFYGSPTTDEIRMEKWPTHFWRQVPWWLWTTNQIGSNDIIPSTWLTWNLGQSHMALGKPSIWLGQSHLAGVGGEVESPLGDSGATILPRVRKCFAKTLWDGQYFWTLFNDFVQNKGYYLDKGGVAFPQRWHRTSERD